MEPKYVQINFRRREIEGSWNFNIIFGLRFTTSPPPPSPHQGFALDPTGGLGGPRPPAHLWSIEIQADGPEINLNFHQYPCIQMYADVSFMALAPIVSEKMT